MVPRQPKTGNPQFTMRMAPELRDRLEKQAAADRRSLAQMAAIVIELGLAQVEKASKAPKK